MSAVALYAADLVGVSVLLGLHLARHGRREMVVAYLGVNVGVLAVMAALLDGSVGAGLGLGLFGVLSIIRLRSEELAQREVAYYFAALALGLLGGLAQGPSLLHVALMVAVLAALYVGDHPRVAPRTRTRELLLDRALPGTDSVTAYVEGLLLEPVVGVETLRVDLVNDTTLVRVRTRADGTVGPGGPGASSELPAAARSELAA